MSGIFCVGLGLILLALRLITTFKWYFNIGKEVADYCAENIHRFLMDTEAYQEGDMKKALKNAFMTIDEAITTEEVSIPILNYFFMQNTYGNTASCVRVALMLQEYAHKRKSPVKCITLDLQYEFAEN